MEHNYNDHLGEENFLFGPDKELPFAVPQDYFENLAVRIIAKMEVEKELKEFTSLSSIGKQSLFDIPEDYFKSSQNRLEHAYELSGFSNLSSIPKVDFGKMEKDYFDKLSNKILNHEDELKEFKQLSSVEKKNEFELPADYFDAVSERVKEKYHEEKPKATVIPLWRKALNPKFAIAASIALLIGVSAFWYASRQDTIIDGPGDCHTLACLEKNELLNEHNIRDFDEENLYDMVDVESLDKQLSDDSTSVTSDSIIK